MSGDKHASSNRAPTPRIGESCGICLQPWTVDHDCHTTPNRVQEWCREDLPNGERCGKPAEFILWGKLFPKEGLGPRCYDHAAKHAGHRALGPGTVEQYAIYVLPRLS